ncbi:hypothetical protein HYV88_05750 [Candidatus Woesearchaeota archaeon]|nr:hypothetical protein [Candidatus Woesearchaeota archaeon]
MKSQELVDSVEVVKDASDLIRKLADTSCILRVFEDGRIPELKKRQIRVYAETHYDSLSSMHRPKITRQEKEKGVPITFISIAPAYENQRLTFYWDRHNVRPTSEVIQSFGFNVEHGNISIGGVLSGLAFDIYTSLDGTYKQNNSVRDKLKDTKIFNLNDFGWGNY